MSADKTSKLARHRWSAWMLLFALWLAVAVFPINTWYIRLTTVSLLPVLVVSFALLQKRRHWWHWVPAALIALVPIALMMPGRGFDPARLRSRYITSLQAFDRTRYVWGGKNGLGIDCSGLVRKALVNACVQEGLLDANPALLRCAADMWWHDCSARALRDGYEARTGRVGTFESLRSGTTEALRPGDLAVTSDGVHVMAYVGEDRWIEADPTAGRVVVIAPSDSSPWLDRRMVIVRWHMLSE